MAGDAVRVRGALLRQARQLIAGIEPGQSAIIPVTANQPGQRIGYQRINQAAYRLWGAGMYSLKLTQEPPQISVTRLKENRRGKKTDFKYGRRTQVAALDSWGMLCRRYQEMLSDAAP